MTLRDAWTRVVTTQDYEDHMAAVGQAEANALLVRDLLAAGAPRAGSRVLIAGAGPGQMFDFVSPEVFTPYRVICSDINAAFLEKLRQRFPAETVIDDVEDSRLAPGFGAIVLVLVLEHVDWRKALGSLARLDTERFIIVIQENPREAVPVTPGRERPATMRVFFDETPPGLIEWRELVAELAGLGFVLRREDRRPVPDGKTMVGSVFGRLQGSATRFA